MATACGDASETTDSTSTGGQGTEATSSSSTGSGTPTGAGGATTTGTSLFIAPDGDDGAPGTEAEPFATLQHAVDVAVPGDTIVVRGGTYALTTSVVIDKPGTADAPYRIVAFDGEHPVFDASDNPRHQNPPEPRIDDSIAATSDALGLFVTGNAEHWHIIGLEIGHAPYYGVRVYGSHNVFERLVLHDHGASGLEITGKEGWTPSDNLVLNSDSFHNFDPQGNGEDADGFAAKFDSLGPGNVFRGLRAWSNADDGYHFWHAAPVLIEQCWAFDNGFNRPEWVPLLTDGWQGDGMGFKLGQEAAELTLVRVAAWGNKAFGIDENGNGSAGGVTIHHATLVNNTKDGNPIQIDLNDGSPHTVRNTLAFDVDGPAVTNLDGAVDHASNSWNGMTVSAADFVDLDMDALFLAATAPRGSDGSLPPIGLHLSPNSPLVNAGVDLGLPFEGPAPDLGAFELTP
ncbi:MAG: right-handed parallel beta-helix repeat-containing protein [Polyangiaceae bacterium]